ncbi:hypothetical protein B0H12DRAFT_1111288 [Mycena haematopus]|nr:hypothetical protein B0H12DRAFT_1111288 [Mycena haematopus]
MCPNPTCDLTFGECTFAYIPQTFNVCWQNSVFYESAYIYSQAGTGFNFGVYIAESGCEAGLQLPTVNTCYVRVINGIVAFNNVDFYFID